MGIEREIRFRVSRGGPPSGGRAIVQAYLLRGRATLRVRLVEGAQAWLTLKLPGREGRFEWQRRVPVALARALLALPLPRVEKTRLRQDGLEIDRLHWPERLVLCEWELAPGEGPDLRDAAGRSGWMEARRPAWVEDWHDVTDDPDYTNAALARRRPCRNRRASSPR